MKINNYLFIFYVCSLFTSWYRNTIFWWITLDPCCIRYVVIIEYMTSCNTQICFFMWYHGIIVGLTEYYFGVLLKIMFTHIPPSSPLVHSPRFFLFQIRTTYSNHSKYQPLKILSRLTIQGTGRVMPLEKRDLLLSSGTYSWIAFPGDAHEELIFQQTRRVTTLSRPPLESSRRGESDSARSIFV